MTLYQAAARVWLTAAVVSLFLPPRWRVGLWLPLHLTLAGGVSVAISGAMQMFAATLTATPSAPAWTMWSQFVLAQLGAASIAIGFPTSTDWLVAVGGSCFVVAMLLLGTIVRSAWRRGLNHRHAVPMAAYGLAISAVLVGGTFGALMGSGVLSGPVYLAVRRAHMTVNVLGWGGLTVVGTLITLLPTVLRVRIPAWRGAIALGLLGCGLAAIVVGLAASRPVLAAGGGLVWVAGVVGVLGMIRGVLEIRRTYAIPLAGLHMLAAVAWFTVGSIGLAWSLLHGAAGFDAYRPVYLTAFVGGFLVQVLLGAWSFLLPMHRPGHPDERRRSLSVFEVAAVVQVVLLNVGLILVGLYGAGWAGEPGGTIGSAFALTGGGVALAKAWFFPLLRHGPVETGRARAVWGPAKDTPEPPEA
jgi:nitrite reductase (NO-forming)